MRLVLASCIALSCCPPCFAQEPPDASEPAYGGLVDPRRSEPMARMRGADAYPGTELGELLGKGMAAWYQHSGVTASGATFDPEKLTAASPNLPLGTKVRVVNRKNDRSVVVEVNDRMTTRRSIRRKFTIELSRAGARAIDMEGIAPVSVYADDQSTRTSEAAASSP